MTLILIGSIGSGKSSTGNTLIGRKQFKTGLGSKRITTEIQRENISFGMLDVTLIDTRGLQQPSDVHEILKNLSAEENKNVIFAINIAIGRYTLNDKLLITSLMRYYRSILKKVLIVFTREDELKNDSCHSFQSWLEDVPSLMKLIETYRINYFALDNSTPFTEWQKIESLICSVLTLEPSSVCIKYQFQNSDLQMCHMYES